MMAAAMSTEVLCLLNMVTEEELKDDEEFEGQFFQQSIDCQKILTFAFFF